MVLINSKRLMQNPNLRMLNLFKKHCKNCKDFCCLKEFNIAFFREEIKAIAENDNYKNLDFWKKIKKYKEHSIPEKKVIKIKINNGCVFLGKNGCQLEKEQRPLDCITYPVFPVIDFNGKEKIDVFGILVHKGCYLAKDIAKDKILINKALKLWEEIIREHTKAELVDWLSDCYDKRIRDYYIL